jgi:hypothetical protein
MELPEHLRVLIDHLGQALVQALVTDPESRALAQQIQAEGFDIALMLEATVALHKREPGEPPKEAFLQVETKTPAEEETPTPEPPARPSPSWSEEDKAFLHTFKIKLDE